MEAGARRRLPPAARLLHLLRLRRWRAGCYLIFFLLILAVAVLPQQPRRHVHGGDHPLRAHGRHGGLRLCAHVCKFYGADGRWAWNLVLSATLFPLPFLLMFCFLNTVAIGYNRRPRCPLAPSW